MRLKENSGMPPPRISSNPRTPVGSLRIVSLAGALGAFSRDAEAEVIRLMGILVAPFLSLGRPFKCTMSPGELLALSPGGVPAVGGSHPGQPVSGGLECRPTWKPFHPA